MGLYDRYVLPHLIDAVCGMKLVGERRARLLSHARGVVLEPGIGGGLNLPYYDAEAVSKVVGVDPSRELGRKARRRAMAVSFPVELHARSADEDVLAPESIDTVVLTYTLCTVPDPASLLAAAFRALRAGGTLLFCEHGRAPDADVQRVQDAIEPVWKQLAGGCRLTRDAVAAIRAAGFSVVELDERYVEQTPRFGGFHQIGRAEKPRVDGSLPPA